MDLKGALTLKNSLIRGVVATLLFVLLAGYTTLFSQQVLLQQAVVVLSDAKIKVLHTTPQLLVTRPGAGKVIIPLRAVLRLTGSAGYTNTEDQYATLRIEWNDGGGSSDAAQAFTPIVNNDTLGNTLEFFLGSPKLNPLLHLVPKLGGQVGSVGVTAAPHAVEYDNHDLILVANNVSDYTGGAPGNQLTVTVLFVTYDLTTGQFTTP